MGSFKLYFAVSDYPVEVYTWFIFCTCHSISAVTVRSHSQQELELMLRNSWVNSFSLHLRIWVTQSWGSELPDFRVMWTRKDIEEHLSALKEFTCRVWGKGCSLFWKCFQCWIWFMHLSQNHVVDPEISLEQGAEKGQILQSYLRRVNVNLRFCLFGVFGGGLSVCLFY